MLGRSRRPIAATLAVVAALLFAAPAQARRLVRYDAYGGLAGLSAHLFVNTDGTARQSGTTSRRFSSRPPGCAR